MYSKDSMNSMFTSLILSLIIPCSQLEVELERILLRQLEKLSYEGGVVHDSQTYCPHPPIGHLCILWK